MSMFAMLGNTNLWHVILGCCAYRAHTRTGTNILRYAYARAATEDRKAEIVPVCRIRYVDDCVRSCVKRSFQFDQQSTQTVVTNAGRGFVTGSQLNSESTSYSRMHVRVCERKTIGDKMAKKKEKCIRNSEMYERTVTGIRSLLNECFLYVTFDCKVIIIVCELQKNIQLDMK